MVIDDLCADKHLSKLMFVSVLSLSLFLSFSLLFRAAGTAYGSFQARGHIGAAAASLYHSHSNARSEQHL